MADFNILAANDILISVTINNKDGTPATLTSPVAFFIIYQDVNWAKVIFQRDSTGSDVTISQTGTQWTIAANILSTDTADLCPGNYNYEFMVLSGGKKSTIRKGQFKLIGTQIRTT